MNRTTIAPSRSSASHNQPGPGRRLAADRTSARILHPCASPPTPCNIASLSRSGDLVAWQWHPAFNRNASKRVKPRAGALFATTPLPSRSRPTPAAAPHRPWRTASALRGSKPRQPCEFLRLALQRPARRTDFERALRPPHRDRGRSRNPATDGHASISTPVKPASLKDAAHARFGGKRERAGIFRPLLRQLRHVLVGGLQRRHEERVFARLAPAGECQPARRPQRLAHVGKRQRGIGKEHHAEARDQQIETCRTRTDRRWRPPARNRSAGPSAHSAAPAPASGPICRCRSTWPDGATLRANAIVVAPLPQPTSMTRSPGFGLARSITRSATGPSTMSCAACRSAQR